MLIEGDFVGQTEVAVALPVVEEYHAEAVMPGGAIERLPGEEGLILRGERVFDERGFGLLRDGQKSAIIIMVTIRKSIYRLGLYYG